MIVRPMIRNNICLSAHAAGCAAETQRQIDYVLSRRDPLGGGESPEAVLVLGASGGYGLASRIAAAFGYGAATVGISLERSPTATKTASPGYYNNLAFDAAASKAGLVARSLDIDAYSDEAKAAAIAAARELGVAYDLVIYSLASPLRLDPRTGILHRSVIKPIGASYRGRTVDVFTARLSEAEVGPATAEEAEATVKVMGGEDWELWIKALAEAGVLAPPSPRSGAHHGAMSLAYSYIGPELSWPIYKNGTLGKAKADLERAAKAMTETYSSQGLRAFVAVNKAVVTRASSVIPVIPLYVSVLFKVMKARGDHEDCVAQMERLFRDRLYPRRALAGAPALDAEGRIRMDDLEMSTAVQTEVEALMAHIEPQNVSSLADLEGFKRDFLAAHGFGLAGVDYEADLPAPR